jgi:basic membrane protein A
MSLGRWKKGWLVGVLVVPALAVGLVACGGDSATSTSTSSSAGGTTSTAAAKELKIGAALIGPKNDKSFNQAAYEGLQKGMSDNPGRYKLTATLENRETDQARTDAVETLAPINDIILGVSASFGPVFDVEATKFPNAKFFNIAGYTQKFHPNVYSFANDWGAPAYVAGAIAATMTKSKIVGYVGGAEIPPTVHGANGFAAGVKSVDPSIKVLRNIVGDFNDVAKAKAATSAMINDKADVIFPFLDAGIAGSYAAGKESGKNPAMFKLTIEDCTSYANIVGTEIVNNVAATSRMLSEYAKGTLKPGATFLDLQDPNLQTLKLCPKYQENKEVADITKKTIDDVNSGTVKLPANAINARPDYPYKEGFDGEVQNADKGS